MSPTSAGAAEAGRGHEPLTAHYAPAEPVDLVSTLAPLRRGPHDPCIRVAPEGLWVVLDTPGGSASLLLRGMRGAVTAQAWGDGAAVALDELPILLGSGDDWSELDLSPSPLLGEVRRRRPGLRLVRSSRVLGALVPAVIEQRVTSVEAHRAWRTLVTRFGAPAPGPAPESMRVPPSPETWRRIPSWDWHRAGVDPGRSATVVRAAVVAAGLERTLSGAGAGGGPDVWRRLRTVPGVGEWTAAETAQRSHGDPDAVSFGDYHLASLVGTALVGEPLDDDGLAELLEPWAGQRQRVVRLALASGVSVPRRGARITIQDHRSH
ncbi:DNA-3-methyladenine glycosylase 2 family protein [Herbiconiux moechotypicola]|uniref:3-methyladenine DNA glycosylase n=1 Tax=Herbiconiux moechotypicola TaxID=637393 RepID=A0ABP5Q660_9MICO|nr:DNA-3-methyladenine glycosylase 2 family protein [Herbiconiux moechotypicola]MCS5728305.1 DNA-3-methyladenine glycosylase 2 family protein [Herbiconiux moechotypicola]